MRQTQQSLTRRQIITFSIITAFGVLALLFGIFLIIYMQYHERAYGFLGLGAACFIGGCAGITAASAKIKAALSYGVIALGIIGVLVGINYLTYLHSSTYQDRGQLVIALSIVVIAGGVIGALLSQPRGFAAISSIIMLGVIASIGVAALIVGAVFLLLLNYPSYAYPLLVAGALCLVAGLACGIFAQSKLKATV